MIKLFNEGELVLMDNDDIYMVVQSLTYNDEEYALITKQVKTLEEAFDDNEERNFLCRVIVTDDDDAYLDPIEDEELMQKILGVN